MLKPLIRKLLAVPLILACRPDLTTSGGTDHPPPPGITPNSLAFEYSGRTVGAFAATGLPADPAAPSGSFVYAFRTAGGEVQLCAFAPTAGLFEGDYFLLNLGVSPSLGSRPLPPPIPVPTTTYQPGAFLRDVDSSRTFFRTGNHQIIAGQVSLSAVSPDHLEGTFHADLRHVVYDSLVYHITSGLFSATMIADHITVDSLRIPPICH
jgi:hypothetical protein